MENTRGSEWRKWDLNLHTASSYDYKYKGDNPNEKLVETLKNHNISVAAITDHFVIDQERIVNLRRLAPEIVFFPGVELRTDKGGSNIHPIIIFDDNINLDELTAEFYHFKKHKAKDKDNNETIRWDYDDIVKFAYDNHGIITIHAGNKKNGIDEQISNVLPVKIATKNEYATTVNILEIGKLEDINAYETYKFPTIGYKPLIMGSDNHNPNKYPNDHNSTLYTWIKADTTFEGLKQTIYEPKTRVKIQQMHPDDKNNSQIIDSITLKEDNFWDNTIYLNDNLNTIIGGRSTGKSTLLKSIALKIDSSIDLDEKEFIERHFNGVSIKWKDNLVERRYIQFIRQNYMYAIAKNEKNELKQLIESIIRNLPEKQYFEDYYLKNKEIEKYLKINLIDLTYTHEEISKLEKQLRIKGDINGIEKEIYRLEQQITNSFSNISISAQEVASYHKIVKEIETIKHQITQYKNDIQLLKTIKNLSMFNDDISFELGKLSSENKEAIFSSFKQLKSQIQNKWDNQIQNNINNITTKIESLNNNINSLEGNTIFHSCTDIYEKDAELINIQTKLKEEIYKLQQIIELKDQINNCKQKEDSLISGIVRKHLEYKINANELTKNIKINHDDIEISTTVYFDHASFYELADRLRNKISNDIFIDYFNDYMERYHWYACAPNSDDLMLSRDIMHMLKEMLWKSLYYQDKSIEYKRILTTNWFYYKFEIKYQNDNFEQMSPGKKAFVILKLLLEFDKKTCPILIDQPEDSLDNRAIYKELVEYIKDKKTKRQIILVTHNPNVVVGADSENVIVANQHGDDCANNNGIKFQYVNGSLENTKPKDNEEKIILNSQGIREHICEILEGGVEAFEKREKKYGFK